MGSIIGRTVVQNENLEIAKALGKDRVNAVAKEMRQIVAGNNEGYSRVLHVMSIDRREPRCIVADGK